MWRKKKKKKIKEENKQKEEMATARTESLGPVVLGLNKQNGQLRGQPKPASPQSGPLAMGKVTGLAQKAGGVPQEGTGIRFGDDWKKNLQLPPKDTRVRTSVSHSSVFFFSSSAF